MKILHPGTLPQNILFTGTCTNCSAQVEANYSEVTRRNLGDRYSGEFIESFVLCPTQGCGRRIIMFEKPSKTLEQCFDQLFPPLPHSKDLRKAYQDAFAPTSIPRKESVRLKLPPRPKKPTGVRTLNDLYEEYF